MAHLPHLLISILLILVLLPSSKSQFLENPIECSYNSDQYTENSMFHQNLINVLHTLNFAASITNSSFYNATFGKNEDAVYGLYLCRGDVSSPECSSCVNETIGMKRTEECRGKKEGIIWNEKCMLRFANRNIFSKEEEKPSTGSRPYALKDPNATRTDNVTGSAYPLPFSMSDILRALINKASFRENSFPAGRRYCETRKDNVTGSAYPLVVYSLAQCTPDISPQQCHKCLTSARSSLSEDPIVADTSVFLPSCQLRYDTKNFIGTGEGSTPTYPPSQLGDGDEERRRSAYLAIAIAVPLAVATILLSGLCLLLWKRNLQRASDDDIITMESLQYEISTIKAATNNFSSDCKLGEGSRFCDVYKGGLHNGQEIVVKRLLQKSGQGLQEFKNEVVLVAKLQHKNLVRFLGYCVTEEEKLLIYEFVANSSLYKFLSNSEKLASLLWETRYNIIEGIAKGLLYLHEYSRYKIIHRDLKPSNILLDKDMTPKISDFGMAKLLGDNQIQGISNTIAQTHYSGYMAPEYLQSGELSVKSDVYSFGVLVLEIVSGKTVSSSFIHTQQEVGLLQYALKLWNVKEPLALIDSTLHGKYSAEEAMRCIHISLLCTQEKAERRPTMSYIVSVLTTKSNNLPEQPLEEENYQSEITITPAGPSQSAPQYSGSEDITTLSPR